MFKKIIIFGFLIFTICGCTNNLKNDKDIKKQGNIKTYKIEIKENPEVSGW